MMDCSKGTDEA